MKKENIILIAIIAFGFILRIFNIESDSFWLDETFSSAYAAKSVEEIIAYCATDVHPPLYLLILHFIGETFNYSDFALRFFSVITGTLAIYGIFLLAKSFFNQKVALLSALLFALSPQALFYSQEARSYMLLVTAAIFSFYFMQQFLKEQSFKRAIPYVLTLALLYYTHTLSVFIIFAQQLYFLYYFKIHKSLLIKWILVHFVALLTFAPWAYHLYFQIISKVSDKGPGSWVKVPDLHSALTTYLFMNGATITMYLSTLLIALFIIRFKFYEKSKGLVLFALWFFSVLVIPFALSFIISPIFLPRFTILFIPAFLIFIAYIIMHTEKFRGIIVAIYLASVAFSAYTYHTTFSKSQWREAAAYLESKIQKDDIVFFHSPWIHTGIKHYLKLGANERAFNALHVYYASKKHQRIWVVKAYDAFSSDKGSIESIENYTKTVESKSFPSQGDVPNPLKKIEPITVTLYEKKPLDGTYTFTFKLKKKIEKKANLARLTDKSHTNMYVNVLANQQIDIVVYGKKFIGMIRTGKQKLEVGKSYTFTLVWDDKILKFYNGSKFLGKTTLKKSFNGKMARTLKKEYMYIGSKVLYNEAFNKELIRQIILKKPYQYKASK